MVRDTTEGKTNWYLVRPGPMLRRWAELMTRGSVKYESDRKPGELRNWQKATGIAELERFIESADRHFAQWLDGDTDEDHAAAMFFNINGAESLGGPAALLAASRPTIIAPPGTIIEYTPCRLVADQSAKALWRCRTCKRKVNSRCQ